MSRYRLLTLAACFVAIGPAPGSEADAPPLRLCTAGAAAGFLTFDGERPEGLEFDLLESFAEALGRPLQLRPYDDFRVLLEAVRQEECDLAAGMLTATPERAERVDFSRPIFPVRVVLVSRQAEPVHDLRQLAGKRVVTVTGTTYEELVAGIEGAEVVRVETPEVMFETLARGDAAAMACDSSVVLATLDTYPGLEIGPGLSQRQHYGFALPKGSPLRPLLDAHLQRLFDSGAYRRFLIDHFGEEKASMILEDAATWLADPASGG